MGVISWRGICPKGLVLSETTLWVCHLWVNRVVFHYVLKPTTDVLVLGAFGRGSWADQNQPLPVTGLGLSGRSYRRGYSTNRGLLSQVLSLGQLDKSLREP